MGQAKITHGRVFEPTIHTLLTRQGKTEVASILDQFRPPGHVWVILGK